MIRQFSLIIYAGAMMLTGCQNQKTIISANETKHNVTTMPKLETYLRTYSNDLTTDSVTLSFTVVNHTDKMQRFCKWETPFEPFLGKYMEIIDDQGNEAQFTGPMAKRVMPPPEESYIQVPPHDSVSTVLNLAKNYSIKPGKYSVKYTGGGISGLEPGNEIQILVNGR